MSQFFSYRPIVRRTEASAYLFEAWGLEYKPQTLAKLACTGGGPVFRKAGRYPLYDKADLDAWAKSLLSPRMTSTSTLENVK